MTLILAPTPRDWHTQVINDSCIYIFGGNNGFNLTNDFYEYDIETNLWTEITSNEYSMRPSPRQSHSAAIYDDFMYVFGGQDSAKARNDLHQFWFSTKKWTEIKGKQGDTWPSNRYNSLVTVERGKMYLYGGKDSKNTFTDFLFLDLTTLKWTEIKFSQDERPSPKINYSLLSKRDSIVLIGGTSSKTECFEFKLSTKSWSKIILDTLPIVVAFNHLGNVVDDNFYLIFGRCIEFKKNDLSKFINRK